MEVASLMTSAKIAYDIAKGIASLKSEVERNQAISKILKALISVQSDALSVQADHAALIAEKASLEKELLRLKTWETEKQRYELKKVGRGVFAYVSKDATRGSEPIHWLCSNCYANDFKSIMQYVGGTVHQCPKCKNEISLGSGETPVVDTHFDPRNY